MPSNWNSLEREKKIIAEAIRHQPVTAAMFEKNWNRYAAVVNYAVTRGAVTPDRLILDYGSGYPFVSKLLLLLGYPVCSYEPYAAEGHLDMARTLGMEACYTRQLPPDAQFSSVLMIDVIEHLSIIRDTMTDVAGRTAPGGFLVVSTPNVMRIEMWLRFLMRQTGHPQPIETFVRADNNYVDHQREFTMPELQYTLRHYGFRTVHADTLNTQPSREALAHFHRLLGRAHPPVTARQRLKEALFNGFRKAFPRQFANNLLVIARKE
jgi:SAM-dependent methyltransferase